MKTESFVERFLISLKLRVDPIPVGTQITPQKTPDFIVSDSAATYLIEVKDKFPDLKIEQQRRESLDQTETWEEEISLGFQNSISSVVREACDQLAAYDPEAAHFRLLWLHARGRYPDDQLEQRIGRISCLIFKNSPGKASQQVSDKMYCTNPLCGSL
jgi:hypothetical protein